MQTFKDYKSFRFSDQQFQQEYYQNCSICGVTIKIIEYIKSSSVSINEIAKQVGIPVSAIRNLETADCCCLDSVLKLAAFFDIPRPEVCMKEKVIP